MVDDSTGPSAEKQASPSNVPRLMAVVEVDKSERVFCAQPGCHHTVYKAIHIVKEGEQLLVLGSTCFEKRYGGLKALGKAHHWGGNGKLLTSEERALLAQNTQTLLARFENEEGRLRREAVLKRQRLREASRPTSPVTRGPATPQMPRSASGRMSHRAVFPWTWMKSSTSVAAFKFQDGSGWVRVQHKDARQFIVPWPSFEGWDEALPPVVGRPNTEVGGYEVVGALGDAVAFLRAHAHQEKVTGFWAEALAVLSPNSTTS